MNDIFFCDSLPTIIPDAINGESKLSVSRIIVVVLAAVVVAGSGSGMEPLLLLLLVSLLLPFRNAASCISAYDTKP